MLPDLEKKFALLGFYEAPPDIFKLVNHVLLLFKMYVYHARDSGFLSPNDLLSKIVDIGKLESSLAPMGSNSYIYESKWRPLNVFFT